MTCSSGVENLLDLPGLVVRPVLVHRPSVGKDPVEDRQETEGDDGFLVDDVQLVGDGPDGHASGCGENGGFAGHAGTWKSIDDGLRGAFGVLRRHVRGVAVLLLRGERCDERRESSEGGG